MRALRTLSTVAAGLAALATTAVPASATASAHHAHPSHAHMSHARPSHHGNHTPSVLVSGLSNGFGSTVGPDGALYVTESALGRVTRVDLRTGARSTYASGLPTMNPDIGIGGAMDVAFLHGTAYALVTLVDPLVGGASVDGIYRVSPGAPPELVADIGAWSLAHPPATDFFVPTGVLYAMEPWRGGFLVTDGHHNRVLDVRLDGTVSQFRAFDNTVPTGLERMGRTVLMAEAGPVPHRPADGRVVAFRSGAGPVSVVASGAPLMVDVERWGHRLYVLSQGDFSGDPEGSPALPDTGSLQRVNPGGTLTPVATGLDRPTSLELVGKRAYVVTLDGEVWRIPL